ADVKKSKQTCLDQSGACGAGDQRNAGIWDNANAAVKARTFYASPSDLCPSTKSSMTDITEEVARQIDRMPFDRPVVAPLPERAPTEPAARVAVYAVLMPELDALRANAATCRGSTFYVTPTGAMSSEDLPPGTDAPTLCIDRSSFALDRP